MTAWALILKKHAEEHHMARSYFWKIYDFMELNKAKKNEKGNCTSLILLPSQTLELLSQGMF